MSFIHTHTATMICNRCLRAAARPLEALRTPSYRFSAAFRLAYSTTPTRLSQPPPAATSTSAAQPFSEPLTPASPKQKKDKSTKRPVSSIAAGQKLKGLNLLKGKEDPVALADEEYPAWLWTILDPKPNAVNAGAEAEGDLYGTTRRAFLLRETIETDSTQPNPPNSVAKQPKPYASARRC